MSQNNITELIRQYDNGDMFEAIRSFPAQIIHSVDQMKSWEAKKHFENIQNILVLGMGGSAIGGDIVKVIAQNDCKIPIIVNRSYRVPSWVSQNTLVIASSYSGNTEETLSAYQDAKDRGANFIAMTTGGKLAELANLSEYDIIPMISGLQPRAAVGYSFTLLIGILIRLGFLLTSYFDLLSAAAQSIIDYTGLLSDYTVPNHALDVSRQLMNTIPVIYGSEDTTWVAALRMRGQLAENSKMMAFHHHIPEMNHNEIEGWGSYPELLKNFSIVWIPDESDHSRSLARMDITENLLSGISGAQIKLNCEGNNRLERLLKLIHLIDWISYYLALLNQVDPSPVNRIMKLKSKMSEIR
ncbi:MAG: bifunctional phosphoglucose/phosphomannose isomerase [Candidatus Marinimicrobia bacterium]|nr:bifunctional phosphoglucose/phosphomannose isomerase [Candidatus Neomarinimicrobiota bacterium]